MEVSCGKVVRTYSTNLADHKDESGSSLQLLRYSQRYEPMAHTVDARGKYVCDPGP